MKYWKNLQWFGSMKESEEKPAENGYWVEASEQEYLKYKMRVDYAMASLNKAVAYKKRILRVDD